MSYRSTYKYHYSEIFVPSKWTKRHEVVVGRSSEFEKLEKLIKTPGAHAILYGQRGVGKTTIRDHFSSDLPERGYSVVTIMASPGLTYTGLVSRILNKLGYIEYQVDSQSESQASAKMFGIGGGVTERKKYVKPERNLLDADFVAELIGENSEHGKIVVIIDEFDVLKKTNKEDSIDEHLPYLLRACSHLADNNAVHFIIVGLAFSGDSLIKGHKSLARSLVEVRVPRLRPKDVEKFFKDAFRLSGFTAQEHVIKYLMYCSAGYPYTMHYIGENVCEIAEARSTREISTEIIRAAFPIIRDLYSRKSRISYRNREHSEIEVLLRMAFSWKDGLSSNDLLKEPKKGLNLYSDAEVKRHLDKLKNEGILVLLKDAPVFVFEDPYTRVKIMIDRETKEISRNRNYPPGPQGELPL